MINWSKGYTSEYHATIVDPITWRDIDTLEITGGTVKRELTTLKESATIACTKYPEGVEHWIRIWIDATQEGNTTHTPVYTGLATSPAITKTGSLTNRNVTCFSVLKAVDDIDLLPGWYAAAGSDASKVIASLLTGATPAPYTIADNAPQLIDHIVAEQNETRLTMINKILSAIGWILKIDGMGRIRITPPAAEPVATIGQGGADVIEDSGIKITHDLYNCPNVFVATVNDETCIVKDEDPESPLSIPNRGREVWARDTSASLPSNESLEDYTKRQLKEAQQVSLTADYRRRYLPDITPGDMIQINYPGQLTGYFNVVSQSIDIKFAATTSEKVAAVSKG